MANANAGNDSLEIYKHVVDLRSAFRQGTTNVSNLTVEGAQVSKGDFERGSGLRLKSFSYLREVT